MTRLNSRMRYRCAFTCVDLLVIGCIAPLICAGCWGYGGRSSETANRVKCASNLRQIGQAILLYTNDNGGHYPRTVYVGGAEPTPVWGTGAEGADPFTSVQPNDVTAPMFLLLRTQDITSEIFTCPSSNTVKDLFGGGSNAPINRSNFTDVKKNLSYSMHNAYVKDGVVPVDDKTYWTNRMMNAEFAVAADINPGTLNGDDVTKPTVTSSAKDMKWGNSNNHDKDGQNILYTDGHVAWESSPFVGIDRDNIYTAADGKVIASPATVQDSILLPTDD